jgi:hypothetical protein
VAPLFLTSTVANFSAACAAADDPRLLETDVPHTAAAVMDDVLPLRPIAAGRRAMRTPPARRLTAAFYRR